MPDVVLPVLNEAESLPWVLGRMPAGFNPIVIDNGSTDGSAEIAHALGAIVLLEPQTGFGAACFTGVMAAGSGVICFMDADGSLDPQELPRVAIPVLEEDADLVLGARVPDRRAWPLHTRLANRFLAREVRRRTGLGLTDIGPMRATRREPLLRLGIEDRRSGWPLEMVLRAATAGWSVAEVAIAYAPRSGGRSKVTGSVRGTARAARDMSAILART